MNKIVDRPADNSDGVQPENSLAAGETGEFNPNSNDSIVTYRTEQGQALHPPVGESSDQHDRIGAATGSAVQNPAKYGDSRPQALVSTLMIVGIIGLSAVGGFLLGQRAQPDDRGQRSILTASMTGDSAAKQNTSSEPVQVATVQAQATLKQNEITDQLGEMRAELLRLHTVFVRLAELAELDDGEFDLTSPLLDWKEQSSVQKIGLLNRRVAHISDNSQLLTSIFDLRRMAYDQKISGRPVAEGHRTSGFGYRTDPISGERLEHLGLDYSGPVGEPILALADGIVTFSGKNSGYGNLVELEHVDGLRTRYAHNQANMVKRGDRVQKGEAIATLGSTGRSTGPHVHIEVRLDGSPIDPGFFVR